jgi:hypothetical protein
LAGSEIKLLGINSLLKGLVYKKKKKKKKRGEINYLIGVKVSKPLEAVQGKLFFFASSCIFLAVKSIDNA